MSRFSRNYRLLYIVAGWLTAASCGPALADEVRVWTDSTGKHKIKASFVSVEDDQVTLEKPDGETIEIPLKKLSKADQKFVADAMKAGGDNPFESSGSSPFESKPKKKSTSKPSRSRADDAEADDAGGGEPRTLKVDYSATEQISLLTTDNWELEVPNAGPGFSSKPKTTALPKKTDFFEDIKDIAVSSAAGRAAVSFVLGRPNSPGTTRVVLCDLATGKATAPASAAVKMSPLAVHDDGKQIVMRSDEFGFGKQDRLEVWTLKGPRAQRNIAWMPYDDAQGGNRDVKWAEFLDGSHLATSSGGGKLVIWSFPDLEPLTTFSTMDGAIPALSPDRKRIAYCTGKEIGIYDVVRGEVAAQQALPQPLQWPSLAFSPSGKKLACTAFDKLLVWDVATGALERTIPCTGIHVNGPVQFPDDHFVLVSGKVLIDVENQLKLWTYEGPQHAATSAGWTFFAVGDAQKPGALIAVQLPHPAATSLLKKALTQPDLFVLRAGTTVKLNLNGIPDAAQREAARKALTERLQKIDCTAGENGTIELAASMEGPKDRTLSYRRGGGDYKFKEFTSRLKFVYQGQPAWERTGTNVPGVLTLKKGENVADKLREHEKPNYAFFENVELPKFLQKPVEGQQARAGALLTLGQSRVTTSGLQ